MKSLIGRHTEIAKLKAAADSQRSEFVALYGRRRVGKTFLINQMFEPGFISQKSSFRELPRVLRGLGALCWINGCLICCRLCGGRPLMGSL